jgi:hypothetical protein
METFCRGDVLCGDVLYVRQIKRDKVGVVVRERSFLVAAPIYAT